MKCPYCGKEMLRGFIQSRDGVTWEPKKRLLPIFAYLSKDAVHLGNDSEQDFSDNFAIAYRCADCKKIIIGYGEEDQE